MARNHYSPALVSRLVRLVLEEKRPLTHVARSEGIHPGVLSKWVKREREDTIGTSESPCLKSELETLRERVRILEERQDTLRGLIEKIYLSRYA